MAAMEIFEVMFDISHKKLYLRIKLFPEIK